MKRKKKSYVRPKKPFEKVRIEEENELRKKYGLKSKREIWKTLAKINYFRSRAKSLSKSSLKEQENFFTKLKAIGLNTSSIADALSLKIEDLLERRLPTIVAKQKLASTPQQARQMVVHKKIIVGDRIINVPSYIVPVDLEKKIKVKIKQKQPKPKQDETKQGEAQ